MIIVSEHHISIDQVDFYLPNNRCAVIEYCQTEPDPFSIEKMETIWKPGFLDPEFQYRFFSSSTARSNVNFARPTKGEAAEFARRIGAEWVYCAAEETASDMAVKVVNQILNRAPGLSKEIGLVIHYHSTLNQKLYSSTPGRLQHEAGLNGASGFSVSQKNGAVSLIAMRIAIEALIAEPDLKSVLLAGSDKLVPPYERVFGKRVMMGDSASAMIIRRGGKRCRPLALNFADFPEWWNPYHYDEERMRSFEQFLAEQSRRLLHDTLSGLGIGWREVALLLPPNLNPSFIRLLSSKAELPADKIYARNISRYGYLMASDPAINLKTALDEGAVKPQDIILALNLGLAQSIGCVALQV